MKRTDDQETQKAKWSVVVLFEDDESRDKAVAFCEHLVERFWKGFAVEINWWSFLDLCGAEAARQSAESAGTADVVLFASGSNLLPLEARSWAERWIEVRGDREGTLVNLCGTTTESSEHPEDSRFFLHKVAQRAGVDYFTGLPHDLARPIPDSVESYAQRADKVTSVLDEILKQPSHPQDYVISGTKSQSTELHPT